MGVPEQNIGPFEARGFDKTSPAGGGQAVALAPVTATHDAVDRTGILDSQLAGHCARMDARSLSLLPPSDQYDALEWTANGSGPADEAQSSCRPGGSSLRFVFPIA